MKSKLFTILASVTLLATVACVSEEDIPQPGDYDFIGPVLEDEMENIPQPGDIDFIGPVLEGKTE